jgi:thiamine biosynthesis lipoprotein ApbE
LIAKIKPFSSKKKECGSVSEESGRVCCRNGKTNASNRGVTSGIVNASGDLTTWGNQADGKPWTVGIADPDNAKQPFSYMNITNMAVATSGIMKNSL